MMQITKFPRQHRQLRKSTSLSGCERTRNSTVGLKIRKHPKNKQKYFPNLLVNTEFMSNLKEIGEIKAVIAF